jgi:hypothetical protein
VAHELHAAGVAHTDHPLSPGRDTDSSGVEAVVSAEAFDDADQLVGAVALLASEADEVFGAGDDCAALGAAGDGDAAPAAELEQFLVAQQPQRAQDGVGVDLEHGGEVARGRQPFAWLRFAVGDRAADLGGDLLVQFGRLVAVDLDTDHGASNSSAIMGSVLVPPSVTEIEREIEPAVDPEALIEEARQRQRSRRRRAAAIVLVVVAAGALAFGIVRLVSGGGARVAADTPKGLFVDRSAFAGHGVLAFVSRGGLFVLDGRSQKLTAITAPGERASDPRFSPNGSWLAYTIGAGRLGLARSDGSSARVISRHAGGAAWLPNGDLLMSNGVFRLDANARLVRVGAAPTGSVAWSPDGDRFAFVSRTTVLHGRNGAFYGVERLQVADSLTGKRTTWRATPFSFTRKSGFRGNVLGGVRVLPDREGILFWVDPDQSNSYAADGLSVYELRAPLAKPLLARPVRLGVTVGDTVSVGPGGRLAIGVGGNRYAWITKNVETCDATAARCTSVPTPPGRLSIDPALSPDGKALAFVNAAARPEGDFRQPTISRWYATHTLRLLRAGTTHATEVAGTEGAASPVWSSDGGYALWLIPKVGVKPEKIAGPLYPPNAWPSYYGQVGWTNLFAWASR